MKIIVSKKKKKKLYQIYIKVRTNSLNFLCDNNTDAKFELLSISGTRKYINVVKNRILEEAFSKCFF